MRLFGKLAIKAASYKERADGDPLAGVSASDIAAALAKITNDSGPSLLARAKYGLDERSARKLLARIKGAAVASHGEIDLTLLQAIGEALLQDILVPSICLACNGNKHVQRGHKMVACNHCYDDKIGVSTGIRRRTDLYMAQALGISREEWRFKWRKRYFNLLAMAFEWEYQAKLAILKNIVWPEEVA